MPAADFAVGPEPAPTLSSFPVPSAAEDDADRESSMHPALASPDPGAGGSFVGFADVGMDADLEGAIVPDRFDVGSGEESPASQAGRRDGPSRGRDRAEGGRAGKPEAHFSGSFEAEFDLADDEPVPAAAIGSRQEETTGGWMPPPEAPPAETWQGGDEREEMSKRDTVRAAAPVEPHPAAVSAGLRGRGDAVADGQNVPLTPEMIDLIAEKVVQRLADRVVREVAWEVVPGVAEALVRKRIKELEESTS